MENNAIIERIKFLMIELNLKQVDFARRIGIDTSNMSKYLNGRLSISDSLVNRIVVNLGVSKQWLEDGSDLPFAKPTTPTTTTVATTLQRPVEGATPVYDIDVTAGTLPRARLFADDQITGWVSLKQVSPDSRIIRVSGDSMEPIIKNGAFIAIRELTGTQYIAWGQIYVILLDDYRLVKYIRKHDDPALVILRSANPEYDDMIIARKDIRELMLVQQILQINACI